MDSYGPCGHFCWAGGNELLDVGHVQVGWQQLRTAHWFYIAREKGPIKCDAVHMIAILPGFLTPFYSVKSHPLPFVCLKFGEITI